MHSNCLMYQIYFMKTCTKCWKCAATAIKLNSCSLSFKGLSDCSLSDGFALGPLRLTDDDTAHVQNLTAYFKLCCEDRVLCALCVGIDIEVIIHLEKDSQDEDHSGQHQEDDDEGASSRKGIMQRWMKFSKSLLRNDVVYLLVALASLHHADGWLTK